MKNVIAQPNAHDWMAIGNDFRRVLGLPPLTEPDGIPTEEFLDHWEELIPGSKERLKEMAHRQMCHRLKRYEHIAERKWW